jgi:hypothetical protein
MILPDIIATERIGYGYLSTIFTDPSDLVINYRKWIFGDGTIIEGSNLSTVYHTYYSEGEYNVILVARTNTEQYVVKKEKFIIINKYRKNPLFIIAQSFNKDTGEFWKFYINQDLCIIFEDNNKIIKSRDPIKDIGKWKFVSFDKIKEKLYIGDFSYFLKEIEIIKMPQTNIEIILENKTEILTNSSLTIDELKIWNKDINIKDYYIETRGRAGYLDSL